MSNGFDPDHDRHSVGPDLGPICLQRLSADTTKVRASKEGVLRFYMLIIVHAFFCHLQIFF